ncbi:MAG TPA: efflux RND transporter periplasmic adaptor subunit [Xanthobacteraceae bacterium]|nr:efflux RND transporter periplasmic adaptor subunit [Xanthobacteraceae bacterium]
MKRLVIAGLLIPVAIGIGGAGYWLGRRNAELPSQIKAVTALETAAASTPAAGEKKVLYYRDPMGKPDYSPVPKKDSMGMDYLPVYEGEGNDARPTAAAPASSKGKGKILYYRNPMGLPDTSPVPKKDSMGMDYIPVYENDEGDDGKTIKISLAKVQKLGVEIAPVERRSLSHTIRAVGTVQADERRLFVFNTKFEGWIDKLHVNATGDAVHRGEPLMEVYAPELVVAEQEYLLAWRALQGMTSASTDSRAAAKQLADASLLRLQNWDISEDQLKQLEDTGKVSRTLTLRSPADGVVLEKTAVEGMRFSAGEPLYRIADLTTVWVIAEVFEQDLGAIRKSQEATITVNAYPGATFLGKVDFIYPTVSHDTRTGKVRVLVPNPDQRLKPGMYANVALGAAIGESPVLAVPESAVIDSGTRQSVLVDRGEGNFEPRDVKLGAHADRYYEVREGLKEGERVVTSANFLIDAESNLRAAFKTFTPSTNGDSGTPSARPASDKM